MARKGARNSGEADTASESLRLTLAERESQTDRKREIATALHAVARRLNWRVGEFHWDKIATSYNWVDIEHDDERFIVAFEYGSRVVALARREPPDASLHFFDDAAFVAAVQELSAPFIVLSSRDLQNGLSDADRKLLAEHPTVYWPDDVLRYRHLRIGDFIFNWWH